MPDIVIADTSCLIVLDKVNELELLKQVYGVLFITPEVQNEFAASLPDWIKVEEVKDKKYQRFLETEVDRGEASVMALAMEKNDSLLILDDLRARKLAARLALNFTGTLGVVNKAKEKNIINKIKPFINKLTKADFRIDEKVIGQLLKGNNESTNN